MNPIQELKTLNEKYSKIFNEVVLDYYNKKITAIEAWNTFPPPQPNPDISGGNTITGFAYPHPPPSGRENFFREVYLELILQAYGGPYLPFPLVYGMLERQQPEFYNKYLKEANEKRTVLSNEYANLKIEAEKYRQSIREKEQLEINRIYNEEKKLRHKRYAELYEEELMRHEIRKHFNKTEL